MSPVNHDDYKCNCRRSIDAPPQLARLRARDPALSAEAAAARVGSQMPTAAKVSWYVMVCHGMSWYDMVWHGMAWYVMLADADGGQGVVIYLVGRISPVNNDDYK